jgi:transcriptional regulator with XRE-family HTH domain
MTIGERIKARRNELQLSQRDLCEKMGYSNHSTIGKIEAGKVDIPQSRIVQFAEVLGVSVAYLMGWDEEIKADPVGAAERHFEILMDEDIVGIFEEFKLLDGQQRQLVKDLVHNLAQSKKNGSLNASE